MELEYTYFAEIGTRENNEDCLRVVTVPEYNRTLPHGIAEGSDDTQMTLYTACGLLNGYASSVTIKSSEELSRHYVWEAYEEWHALQISSKPVVVNPVCDISRLKAMQDWRAPGMTCMYALREKKLFII